ncbi:MAG: GxxExxY protein [Phycisphaerales bacterium]
MPDYARPDRYDRPHDRGRGGRGGGGGGGDRGRGRGGMPLSELDPALTDISRRVIGCAIEVHKQLGPGYPIDIYRTALHSAMTKDGINYKVDAPLDVKCDGQSVGAVSADLYINDRFLVNLYAEHMDIGSQERSELRARLRAADQELGLIINFGERRLKDGLVRVLNPDKLNKLRDEEEEYEDDDEYEDDEDGEYEDDDEEGDDDED